MKEYDLLHLQMVIGANGLRGVNSCTTHKTLYNESLQTATTCITKTSLFGVTFGYDSNP
jgi:hypothetical protein